MLLQNSTRRPYVPRGHDTISVIKDTGRGRWPADRPRPVPRRHVGSTVNLALSATRHGCSWRTRGNNDVDVIALGHRPQVTGAIPTAWYPERRGRHPRPAVVANAKGFGAGPNDTGNFPNPTSTTPPTRAGTWGR